MNIRRAEIKDIDQILDLLSQVLEIHAEIRPDIFVSGHTKYMKEELEEMIKDENYLIYVAEDSDIIMAYAFCNIVTPKFSHTMKPMKILYIDDFCVDKKYRRQHIGEALFDYIKQVASELGCYEIALYHWEGNDSAKKFYEKMGLKVKASTLEYIL